MVCDIWDLSKDGNWLSINTNHGKKSRRQRLGRKLLGSQGGYGGERGPGLQLLVFLAVFEIAPGSLLSLFDSSQGIFCIREL